MKYFSTNSIKLVLTDSRHNFFHWLTVVLIRTVYFLILASLGLYIITIGFSLSKETLQPYFPPDWFEVITFCSAQLPYFPLIQQSMFAKLNHWYRDARVWWTMVVGIPLIMLGFSLFFSVFFSFYYAIFSSIYNRTHCPFCKKPIKVKTK